MQIALLLSPKAKAAFFNDYLALCYKELEGLLELHQQSQGITQLCIGEMDFLTVDIDQTLLPKLARLSFVYGIFERKDNAFIPLDIKPNFYLHDDFIWGSKFKGKTNETLTQFMINIGLQYLAESNASKNTLKLLDPMCGRATTLFWAMRYGLQAKGVEHDRKALDDIRQITKKWCKIHKQKHQLKEGFVGKSNKQNQGKFLDFSIHESNMKIVIGETQNVNSLLKGEKFHLIVSDLPYGIQHFTTENTRNPLDVIQKSAAAWADSLKPGGVIVLAFNRYIPKRQELIAAFENTALKDTNFSAEHRMSESIVRDIIVLKNI